MKNFPALLFALVFFASCQEKTSGCLDPEAINFAVEVDKSCDSCCQYPLLQVNIGPIWGDETNKFSYLKTWTDAAGNPFTIDTIAFYLSDFKLFNSVTGDSAMIMDSVRMRVFPDSMAEHFQRDIILVRPTIETYNVGTLLVKGEFDQIRFKIGLGEAQNRVIPTRAPSNNPLRSQPEPMWDAASKSYFFWKMRLKKDTAATAPLTVLTWPASLGTAPVTLPFLQKKTWKRGISPAILLVIDYQKWFDDVDLDQSDAVIFGKIRNNMAGSFVLKGP